jgi:hypothetical protein
MAYINEFVIRFKHIVSSNSISLVICYTSKICGNLNLKNIVSPSAMSLIIYYIIWSVFSQKNQSKTLFCELCLMPLSIALHINTNFNTQAGTE